MLSNPNALQWTRQPGHYEVYYVTLTDRASGVGLWIRYTMLAPLAGTGGDATCSLWFLAMDPRPGHAPTLARKATFPIDALQARNDPFELRIGDATLTDHGMRGAFEDVAWDLGWEPAEHGYEHHEGGMDFPEANPGDFWSIRVENAHKAFGSNRVLNGLNLGIP